MSSEDWTTRPLNLPRGTATTNPAHPAHEQEGLLEELWERPGTLVLPLREAEALADIDGRLALLGPQEVGEAFARSGEIDALRIYLGRVRPAEGVPGDGILVAGGVGDVPVLAVLVSENTAQHIARGVWSDFMTLSATLDPRDLGLLTRAVALAQWHRNHEFSPRTGRPTTVARSGWVRVERDGGAEHFPRTDPAVIVAVTDDEDRLLLASNTAWEERRFSLIAGFVDPGESLEEAVIREVREESGLAVTNPRYLASQPWPFPASLMVGFSATLHGSIDGQVPDGLEIRELRWFSRNELLQATESGELLLPRHGSIARAIIEAWFGAELAQNR